VKDELLKARGRLAGLKVEHEDCELKIKGLIILARNYIDPYEPNISKLKTKEALKACEELDKTRMECLKIKAKIEELEDVLH
jgi:hypothetical protein